jgi:thiol-disulfide isomerase/thioredoxin
MSPKRPPARRSARPSAPRPPLPLLPLLVGAIVVVGVAVAVVSLVAGGDDGGGGARAGEVRDVTVEGDALVPPGGGADEAVGVRAPQLRGQDFSGATVVIAPDGRPKVLAFVAHWCPHCQAEVPRIAQWLDAHELPGDVELYFVSTGTDANRPNYPPSEWLAAEGVGDVPTLVDDEAYSALRAYGAGSFPYLVYLDAEHRVVLRTEGEYGDDPEVYTALFEGLARGEPLTDPRLPAG